MMGYQSQHTKYKEKFFKRTASHLGFYLSYAIFMIIIAVGIVAAFILIQKEYIDAAIILFTSLIGATSIFGSLGATFYYNKAKTEYQQNTTIRTFEAQLQFAERIADKLKDSEITPQSIALLQSILYNVPPTFEEELPKPAPLNVDSILAECSSRISQKITKEEIS